MLQELLKNNFFSFQFLISLIGIFFFVKSHVNSKENRRGIALIFIPVLTVILYIIFVETNFNLNQLINFFTALFIISLSYQFYLSGRFKKAKKFLKKYLYVFEFASLSIILISVFQNIESISLISVGDLSILKKFSFAVLALCTTFILGFLLFQLFKEKKWLIISDLFEHHNILITRIFLLVIFNITFLFFLTESFFSFIFIYIVGFAFGIYMSLMATFSEGKMFIKERKILIAIYFILLSFIIHNYFLCMISIFCLQLYFKEDAELYETFFKKFKKFAKKNLR